MNVAIVLHSDRHADPEVHVFKSAATAIVFAKALAREFDRFGDLEEKLTAPMQKAGWLYWAGYGESNTIRVETKEVRS
jgi:hypothetical protein